MTAQLDATRAGERLDCQACGACCVEAGAVPVEREDATPRHLTWSVRRRMGFYPEEADAGTRMMKHHMGGRCFALRGEIGRHCSCAIYPRRPLACRQFEPGSEGCFEARETAANKLRRLDWRPRGYGPDWQAIVGGGQ